MRRKHSKLRMGLRGRSGLLAFSVLGTAVVVVVYYTWTTYFSSSSRISYSSVQGLEPGQLEQWDRERQPGFVIDDPPIGLNKEIELQMANEKWKKAKALQDHIDEDRIAQEQAAQDHGKSIDQILKSRIKVNHGNAPLAGGQPLLFVPADPLDGDYFSTLQRVVHLDLKGAPPLVLYLEKLFPVLKAMGATGLLMEYEDMFPYTGNLSVLASAVAYSLSDLQRIQSAAKQSGLEIIPLVQTFGHMEFVLKHRQFRGLREQDYTPQVITPVKQESYALIFNMLEQVLKAHPDTRRIHLGCDEVYELGKGESSNYLTSHKLTPGSLFLEHVVKVARQLKTAFPAVQSLIWDDWLRGISYEDLDRSGVATYVEPMVWYYQHDIRNRIDASKWMDYSNLFSGVWVASAFKGATGSAQILTNASVHLDNNLQWVSVIREYGLQKKTIRFRGMVLTGWQRYDHFATLCELLPVGLPSLAISMQAVKHGGFSPDRLEEAGRVLGCSDPLGLEFPALSGSGAAVTQDCSFPGSEVWYGVQQLWGIMELYRRDVGLQQRISGWMTDYHGRRGISSPGQMKVLAHKLEKVLQKLQDLMQPMQDRLLKIYDKWTIEEWMATNLQDQAKHIRDLYNKAKQFLALKEWPPRPFPEVTTKAPTAMKVPPPAGLLVPQTGPHHVAQHNPPQGPQFLSGRVQVNGRGPNPVVNKPSAYVAPGNGRYVVQGAGAGQKQNAGSVHYGDGQGGVLSQVLLKKADQGVQGRPSGPSKMQSLNRNAPRQGQQPVDFPLVPGQSARGQQRLGQYVPGLPQAQNPLPSGMNMYRVNQNLQAPAAGQQQLNNQQNSVLGRFPNQPVQNPQNWNGLRPIYQGVPSNQQQLLGQPQAQVPLRRPGPLPVQGPQKMERGPVNPQQAPSAKDPKGRQAGVNSAADSNTGPKPEALPQQPAIGGPLPDVPNKDLDQGVQEDAMLDSFVGRRGKDQHNLNEDDDGDREEEAGRKNRVIETDEDYNDVEDHENV